MKRFSIFLITLVLTLPAVQAGAHEGHQDKRSDEAASVKTVSGEVVDTGCYLGHGARGAKHVSCAIKCINNGMPMGLLTDDGTLYLLTMNHDNPDPYNKLKEMAGKTVSVTGTVMARNGMKGIDVTEFRPAPTSSTK